MKFVRLFALLAVLGLLAYGLYRQQWRVESLDRSSGFIVNGAGFIEGATKDRFLRLGGRLVDRAAGVHGKAADAAVLNDCPT